MTEKLINLRQIEVIDGEMGLEPGFNDVLEEGEAGYREFRAQLDNLQLKSIPSDKFETMDGTPGFSSLERKIADQHLRTANSYIRSIKEGGETSKYPFISTELRGAIVFDEIIRVFYLDGQASLPFNTEFMNGMITAIEMGQDILLNKKSPEYVSVSPLPDELTRFIIGKTAAELFESSDFSVTSDKALEWLPSAQDVISDSQYGPMGFYEVGIGMTEAQTSYASPVNLLSPLYGKMMASYIFSFYKELLDKGLIKEGEEFIIYEHGGWDGKFANDILSYIDTKRSSDDPKWRVFAGSVKYVSVEIASAGIEMQKKLEGKFSNFKIVQGDAINWKPEKKGKGVALSVLMLDSFPPQMIYKMDEKEYAGFIAPTIICSSREDRETFLGNYFAWFQEGMVQRGSSRVKREVLGFGHDLYEHLYLTKESFQLLQDRMAVLKRRNPEKFNIRYAELMGRLTFINVLTPAEKVKGLDAYLKRHERLGSIIPPRSHFMNTEIDAYADNIAENYFSIGAMMAVEVGSAMAEELYARMGAIQRPQMMMQAGAMHLSLDSLHGNEFGSTVLYLVPWREFLFDTLGKLSEGNARTEPHVALMDEYGRPSEADLAEVVRAAIGKSDDESMKQMSALFDALMEEGGPMNGMSRGHKIIRAILGDDRHLACYNAQKELPWRSSDLKWSCSPGDKGMLHFVRWGGVSRCAKSAADLLEASLSYLINCP